MKPPIFSSLIRTEFGLCAFLWSDFLWWIISGILKKVVLVGFVGFLAWVYQATKPPPPKTCGSENGPPITAPRIQLKDGRYLAYKEYGVSKDVAKHKIVFVHGFDQCRHDVYAITAKLSHVRVLPLMLLDGFLLISINFASCRILGLFYLSGLWTQLQDIVESRGIYIVSFDRPGYGESSPDPTRTVKSFALDVEELADQLGLGSKFYVMGFSMGGQAVWGCLKYIPQRCDWFALLCWNQRILISLITSSICTSIFGFNIYLAFI